MSLVSFEEVQAFVKSHYKHERLYGRTSANGWDDSYGDGVVSGYVEALNKVDNITPCFISRHESTKGTTISFGRSDVIKFTYEQMKDCNAVVQLRDEILKQLKEMDVGLDDLAACPTLNRQFAVLHVRLSRLNQILKYTFDHSDEHTVRI